MFFLQTLQRAGATTLVGVVCGVGAAAFLHALAWVTLTRIDNPALLYALPVAGVALVLVMARWGGAAQEGTGLVVRALHDPAAQVPARMAPMILAGTLITHLFGGSAGREGTALQMGASLAVSVTRALRRAGVQLLPDDVQALLRAGVAAGFGAVFGTPVAGAMFALEAGSKATLGLQGFGQMLFAAVVADGVARALGGLHTAFPAMAAQTLALRGMSHAVLIGLACGLMARVFVHGLAWARRGMTLLPLSTRPLLGGCLVISLVLLLGNRDYLGLGIPLALDATQGAPTAPAAFVLKLVFTLVTLASGFPGGEVTPLFVIGASMGNALAPLLGADAGWLAMLGFVALFAGASHAPLACALMGLELFGAGSIVHIFAACWVAHVVAGRAGIYAAREP